MASSNDQAYTYNAAGMFANRVVLDWSLKNVLKLWHQTKTQPGQSIRIIYLKKNPAKFHPDPIWNDGALGFFEERRLNNMKNKKKYNQFLIQKQLRINIIAQPDMHREL